MAQDLMGRRNYQN